MAQRSYLMVGAQEKLGALLEAADVVPLLWLGLVDAATLEADWGGGATLRLGEGAAIGLTLERDAALRRLAARRAGVVAWIGAAAGTVLDQFAEFVAAQPGASLRLDVSEWVELHDSREQALQSLRAGIAALDAKVGKRRPPAVKKLLDELGLSACGPEEPAFGALLAGFACSGREPWRREPPRERRAADDYVTWSRTADRQFVSADGRVVATTVTNTAYAETPVIWSAEARAIAIRATEVPDEVGTLSPQALSADGRALFCGVAWHPGNVPRVLRFGPDGVRTIHEGEPTFGVSCCSAAGDVAAGALYPASGDPPVAAVWRDGQGVRRLPDVAPDSVVQRISADGSVLAGEVRLQDAAGQYAGMQAWIWRDDGTPGRLLAAGPQATTWRALSRDGRRGALYVDRLLFWDDATAALVPIEYRGAPPADAVFSPQLRCALLLVDGAMVLWWPDGRAAETTLDAAGLALVPLHVSSAGDWWVAGVRDESNYATAAVLLWQRGRGLQRFDAPASDTRLGLGLYVASACESLDELLLFGQWRDGGEPVTWSPRRGFVAWGDAPVQVPAVPPA